MRLSAARQPLSRGPLHVFPAISSDIGQLRVFERAIWLFYAWLKARKVVSFVKTGPSVLDLTSYYR